MPRKLTPEFLSGTLQEAGGIEANVATGYHAIEFLLWGQDTHGTGPGAGDRPATDYDLKACTHGNCDRRAQYLQVGGRPAGLRHQGDGRQLAATAARRALALQGPRHRRHPHRHGLAELWRARRPAHEARPAAARSGGGARVLLGHHLLSPTATTRSASRTSIWASTPAPTAAWSQGPSISELIAAQGPGARHRDQGPARRHDRQVRHHEDARRHDREVRPDDRRGEHRGQQGGAGRDRRADRPDPRRRTRRGAARSSTSRSRAATASTTRMRCSSKAGLGQTSGLRDSVAQPFIFPRPGCARSA